MSPTASFKSPPPHNPDPLSNNVQSTLHNEANIPIQKSIPKYTTPLNNPRYSDIIVDLGDVVFTYTLSSGTSPVPPKTLKQILRSSTWFEYEKGNLTEEQAYERIAKECEVSAKDVWTAFTIARGHLTGNLPLLDMIRKLRESGRRIYAMSNMSAPDWEVVATQLDPSQWSLFEKVFISAAAHERKPHTAFYKHVLEQTGADPTSTIFIDDKLENVVTARSFGMHGIVFNNTASVVRQLEYLCGDHVQRGCRFLDANRKRFVSVTSSGILLEENFSQLLIHEATGDRSLVDYDTSPGLLNFFRDPRSNSTKPWKEYFPDDLDTTSLAMTIAADVNPKTKHRIMDKMLTLRDQDGLIQVYFDPDRPRIDPVVCVNVLTMFYSNGRGQELDATLDWVYSCLLYRAYIDGTLYYTTAEAFLFFLSRLIGSSSNVRRRFEAVYRERIIERFEVPGDSLALAMRIIAAASVGLVCRSDVLKLLSMQREDGSWGEGWYTKYGSTGLLIGNDGLTTALAIKAILDTEAVSVS